MTDATHSDQTTNKAKAISSHKAAADKEVAAGAERQAKAVKETTERIAGSKPTPTQAEIDAARMGKPVATKEADGSALAKGMEHRTSTAASGGASYKTRDAGPVRYAPEPTAAPVAAPAQASTQKK